MVPAPEQQQKRRRKPSGTPRFNQEKINEAAFKHVCDRLGYNGDDPKQVAELIKRIHFLDTLYTVTSHSKLAFAGAVALGATAALWAGISSYLGGGK